MSKQKQPTLGQRHYSFWSARLDDWDQSYVYVIRGGKKTPVKIGVAKKPLVRLKTLQTGNPQTLRLLLVVPGDEQLERILHERFAEHRLENSEWFYGPGVEQIIGFVTELAVEMVQAHVEGRHDPPSLAGFPGWTWEERHALTRKPTIAMTPAPESALPLSERERARFLAQQANPSYVRTIASRFAGTEIGPRQQNRRVCPQ